jgi:hypothetical protein
VFNIFKEVIKQWTWCQHAYCTGKRYEIKEFNKLIFGPTKFKTPKKDTFRAVNVKKISLPFKSLLPILFQNDHSRDAPFLGQTGYVTCK